MPIRQFETKAYKPADKRIYTGAMAGKCNLLFHYCMHQEKCTVLHMPLSSQVLARLLSFAFTKLLFNDNNFHKLALHKMSQQ